MCLHVTIAAPTITITAVGNENIPAIRWCTYPGERLLKRVSFEVNGNPLDEYTSVAYNFHREFQVPPNKIAGYNRLVGQENPQQGYVDQPNWLGSGVAAQSFRYGMEVFAGAQTPRLYTAVQGLELFVPLLFWFNRDVRLAVPSVAIPYGQRFINVELCDVTDLVDLVPRGTGTWASPGGSVASPTVTLELYINNIFVNPEVHNIYIQRIGFSLIRVHKLQVYQTNKSDDSVLLNQLKWPIEYLFVGMKLQDYVSSSTAATKRQNLQKWQYFHEATDTTYNSGGQLTYKKFTPGVSGTATASLLTADIATNTVRGVGTTFLTATATSPAVAVGDVLVLAGNWMVVTTITSDTVLIVNNGANGVLIAAQITATTNFYFLRPQGLQVTAEVDAALITTLAIQAHGINIYAIFPYQFYNSFTSYQYGGPNINTPTDIGALLVPFCLYPGTYQPSGHINVSRAREFFLNYVSTIVDSDTTGLLYILASAINFLLISDGSAILRYST
jgi:hypothetical protein